MPRTLGELRERARPGSVRGWPDLAKQQLLRWRKERKDLKKEKEETKLQHSIEHGAKEHISRIEPATKTDRGAEFRVPSIYHLRSLYSCPLASLTYSTPHKYSIVKIANHCESQSAKECLH